VVAVLPDAECQKDSKVTRATKVMQLLPCNMQWRKKMFHVRAAREREREREREHHRQPRYLHACIPVQAQWKEGFNGGAKDTPGWIASNPQFILSVSAPSKFVIILNQLEIGKSVGLYVIRSPEKAWRTQVNDDEIVAESEFLAGPESTLAELPPFLVPAAAAAATHSHMHRRRRSCCV